MSSSVNNIDVDNGIEYQRRRTPIPRSKLEDEHDNQATRRGEDDNRRVSFKQQDNYPDHIRVTGLPFMLQGWNCVFYKQEPKKDQDYPVYCLDSYTLYWLIDIIGVEIANPTGNEWLFYRVCDGINHPLARRKLLLGKWHDGIQCTISRTDNSSNEILPFIYGCVMSSALLWMYSMISH